MKKIDYFELERAGITPGGEDVFQLARTGAYQENISDITVEINPLPPEGIAFLDNKA